MHAKYIFLRIITDMKFTYIAWKDAACNVFNWLNQAKPLFN